MVTQAQRDRARTRTEERLDRGDALFALPRWAWLPTVLGLLDLFVASLGFYWDVNWHIELGRDKFLFTPPHDLILIGLGGIGVCGLLAQVLYERAGGGPGIRVRGHTLAPGAAFLMLCSAF